MCDIILIRPPATPYDVQDRIQGRLDLPTAREDILPEAELIARLEREGVSVVLTDPGEPAASFAAAIGKSLRVPVKAKDDLQNVDQGLWEGLQLDEVRRKYPKLLRQWEESPEAICPPDGESVADASARIEKVLKKPLKKKAKTVAVVAAEPLASLIASVVSGEDRLCRGPVCSGDGEPVERLTPPAGVSETEALPVTSGGEGIR